MRLAFGAHTLELTSRDKGYVVSREDETAAVEVAHIQDGRLDLLIDGRRVTAYVSSAGGDRWVTVDGRTVKLTRSSGPGRAQAGSDHRSGLSAPMPGQVRSLNAAPGQAVKKGQTLLVLEAMKMEIRVQAPMDGRVKAVLVEAGQTVEREQILIEVEE
jgi:biotin carboxyl carrier protein